MITISISGQDYECATAVKGSNFIVLYDENDIITASFFNIADFSQFEISGGDWTPYVKNTIIIRSATLSAGLIQLSGYDDIETGTTIVVTAPGDSADITAGISIDGAAYPIVNAMGEEIMGAADLWAENAIISLLIDKENKLAYFMNGGVSEAAILAVADEKGSAAAVKEELQGEIERTSPKVGDLMMSYGDDPGAPWLRLNSGNNYITSSTPELYEKLEVERLSYSLKESLPTSELISTQGRSMGYVNGYWYVLSDSSYSPKLAFKKDGDASQWQTVKDTAFDITDEEHIHLYYTYDLAYFDGKYYILGNNAIFSSENLTRWRCVLITDPGNTSNIQCGKYFHISPDGSTLYTFFGFTDFSSSRRWIVSIKKGSTWQMSGQINMGFYDLIMKPDGTMLGFDNGTIYSSPSITSTAFSKLCTIGKDFRYAEYEPHLDCYLCATTESTRYYAVKDFTADTTSVDLKDVFARDFDYPTAGNIFYNTADKILWTLGTTSSSSTAYEIHYAPAESFDTIGAPIVCSTSVSVRYMAYARVHQKDNTSIFTMNVSSNTASYNIYEFSKCLSLPTNLPPTYILTADLQNQS